MAKSCKSGDENQKPTLVKLHHLEEERLVLRAFLKEMIPLEIKATIREIIASISALIRKACQLAWDIIEVPVDLWKNARNTSSILLLSSSYRTK